MNEREELKRIYHAILESARAKKFISYTQLKDAIHGEWPRDRHRIFSHLGQLVEICYERKWPIFSTIVVNKSGLETGKLEGTALEGLISAAREVGYEFDDAEYFVEEQRKSLFNWAESAPEELNFDEERFPYREELAFPLLEILRDLGGSGKPKLVYEEFKKKPFISQSFINAKSKKGYSKFTTEIRWAYDLCVRNGLISKEQRGLWKLTPEGWNSRLFSDQAKVLMNSLGTSPESSEIEQDSPPLTEIGTSLVDPSRQYWFVNPLYVDGEDQTEHLLSEGVWKNGYPEYSKKVREMKPGDAIAIKTQYTKRRGLPFDNRNQYVSCMPIRAVGTISEGTTDGATVKVDWTAFSEPREWYFYSWIRQPIAQAKPLDKFGRRLILFAFHNQDQDYEYWLQEPYWEKKYRMDEDSFVSTKSRRQEYGVSDILDDGCFLSESQIRSTLNNLTAKRNLILQGPPGTGKTWLAKRMGYALIQSKDPAIVGERVQTIQFHPFLSYEDFVQGWRPTSNGNLDLVDGVFLKSIDAARAEPDNPFVLIIEEINRGNPAQIFGEALTLIEADKRNPENGMRLVYSQDSSELVYVPENLFVVGTMNIADRSLALVDFALRRRFAFVTLEPALNDQWREWCLKKSKLDQRIINHVQKVLSALNDQIENDPSLGAQFKIGHSYVTPPAGVEVQDSQAWFKNIVDSELIPLLDEYWFEDSSKVQTARDDLLNGI